MKRTVVFLAAIAAIVAVKSPARADSFEPNARSSFTAATAGTAKLISSGSVVLDGIDVWEVGASTCGMWASSGTFSDPFSLFKGSFTTHALWSTPGNFSMSFVNTSSRTLVSSKFPYEYLFSGLVLNCVGDSSTRINLRYHWKSPYGVGNRPQNE